MSGTARATEVFITAKAPRKGEPRDIMQVHYTVSHGLGWALIRPGATVAHEFGGFVVPEYVPPEQVAEWGVRRMALYDSGAWVNPGRYDYLISEGWFPQEVREIDKANCVRGKVPNGPAIRAVLDGSLRSTQLSRLRASQQCPYIDAFGPYLVGGRNVAIRWMRSKSSDKDVQ